MSGLEPGARRVLVTGGGSGIGRAVAEALLAEGARVAVAGRRQDRLEAVVRICPGRAVAIPCDLAAPAGRERLIGRAVEALGGLDGLVYAAGISVHQPIGHIDEQALRAQLEVNLVAPLRLGEEALSRLEPGGAMVFVSSTLALKPVPTSTVYSAAKAGLLSVVRSLALAGAARGLRVNALCPGVVDTEMVRELRLEPGEAAPPPEQLEERITAQLEGLRRLHPLGRLGTAEEVAATILYLLQVPWTTGASLVMDGGLQLT